MTRVLFVIALAAAVAIGGAVWLLRAPAGQIRLQELLRAGLADTVEITGLSGRLPFSGRARSVVVRDEEGVWLEATDIAWQVARRPLLRREIVFRRIEAGRLHIHRAPIVRTSDSRREPGAKRHWPIWVQAATVEEFRMASEAAGESFAGRMRASFKQEADGWSAAASVVTEWQREPISIEVSAKMAAGEGLFRVRQIEAEGLRIDGIGSWRPRGEFRFSGSFSNAPLIARLAGLDVSGTGEFDGIITWGSATRAAANLSVARMVGYGMSNGTIVASAAWRGSGADWTVTISEAGAERAGHRIRLTAPARVSAINAGFEWSAPGLAVFDIVAQSAGRWTTNEWDAELIAENIDLAATPLGKWLRGGRGRAALRVNGPPADPVWTLDAEGMDIDVRLDGAYRLNPARAQLAASVSGNVARVKGAWSGWTAAPVEFHAQVPITLGGSDGTFGVDPTGALQGRLHFEVDLAAVGAFTDLRGSEISGWLAGELELAGVWSRPEVRGRIVLTNGNATFAESGAMVRDFNIVLEGDRSHLAISRADGHDGAGGRIAAKGSIRFDPAAGFPLDVALSLDRTTVWRRDGNIARVSGRLALVGKASAPLVTGHLQIAEAEIRLRPTPPPIPRLPLDIAADETRPVANATSYLRKVSLDVGIEGREMRVSGRGLDSSWRASLRATGSLAEPSARGSISIERGFFLFMGRRFTLERAALLLDGRWPPEPLLDIIAVSRAGEMQARLYASGSLDAPTLTLESDPPYPVDEILARLLFGRSTDAISPLQAVRLAHGLNLLRGQGRTIDLLERGQSVLRVDQLEIVQSDRDAGISAISVGKYIGRNIYVEGEKSLGESADLITVEVELTPSLILTTETSPRIREGIGLKWRRDY